MTHLLQVVRNEVSGLAPLAGADDDTVLVSHLADHVLADGIALAALEL